MVKMTGLSFRIEGYMAFHTETKVYVGQERLRTPDPAPHRSPCLLCHSELEFVQLESRAQRLLTT